MTTQHKDFTNWFREIAPYVHTHRRKTLVLSLCGDSFTCPDILRELVWDMTILNSLGLRLVLVFDIEPLLNARLQENNIEARYVSRAKVIDEDVLAYSKALSSDIMLQLAALFSIGLPNSPMVAAHAIVATGNFIVARPAGIIEGVDLQYAGQIRRVQTQNIAAHLAKNEIVILPPLGYAPTGEIFTLEAPYLATQCALALAADKLLFVTAQDGIFTIETPPLRELTVANAKQLLPHHKFQDASSEQLLQAGIVACEGGVERVHYLHLPMRGGLLQELYSRDGAGLLLSAEPFDTRRIAQTDDIAGILALLQPLEAGGILQARAREKLAAEITDYTVVVRDGMVIACVALHLHHPVAELAAFAVAADYQHKGIGSALLRHMLGQARAAGCQQLFVLTTHTHHWFLQHGFSEVARTELPDAIGTDNAHRNSKVLKYQLN